MREGGVFEYEKNEIAVWISLEKGAILRRVERMVA